MHAPKNYNSGIKVSAGFKFYEFRPIEIDSILENLMLNHYYAYSIQGIV